MTQTRTTQEMPKLVRQVWAGHVAYRVAYAAAGVLSTVDSAAAVGGMIQPQSSDVA